MQCIYVDFKIIYLYKNQSLCNRSIHKTIFVDIFSRNVTYIRLINSAKIIATLEIFQTTPYPSFQPPDKIYLYANLLFTIGFFFLPIMLY